jgi:hypothetical protein
MKIIFILSVIIVFTLFIISLVFVFKRKESYDNKTIGIKTFAGLGNQIFQIAFIYALSLKNK